MPRVDDEGGYTLSEVLVALVIVGVAIVAIIGSLGSSVFISRVHRDIVTSDATVRRYAEQLTVATYVPCATPAQYPAMQNVPLGFTATITAIQYADAEAAAPTFGVTCATNPTHEIQRITLVAQRAGGSGHQTLQIVKRAS
jgi:prepilin-type N-terminal cleavage/methylation domain-containing protein